MYEQYVNSFFVPYTVNSYDVTIHTQERKKKKGFENQIWVWKRGSKPTLNC